MSRSRSKTTGVALLARILVCPAVQTAEAADLKKETAAAFDQYVGASEARIKSELHKGSFLFIDGLPEKRCGEAYAQLRDGQILVQPVNTKAEGHLIDVPQGLIHDWIGVLFIPNVSLAQNSCGRPGLRQSPEHLQTRRAPLQASAA